METLHCSLYNGETWEVDHETGWRCVNVVDSVEGAKLRAFVDSLDRRWHWWASHRDRPVPPVIPDARGLIYLPNYAENYVVAVTPVEHDIVYVAEVDAPRRAVSGVLAGQERVFVLSGSGDLHILSPTLMPLQVHALHDTASDLVWAEDTLWLAGEDWSQVEAFAVTDRGDGQLRLSPLPSVPDLPGVQHLLWLPLARTVAAVANETLHFIDPDRLTVESVPLPTTVQHAAAHDALLVFTEAETGYALVLDLASSAIVPLITQPTRRVSDDPIITQHRGYHTRWHGHYVVSLTTIQEPGDDDVSALIQSIEQSGGPTNAAQPELVIHLQEKADFFRLPTVRDCIAGEDYESGVFTLTGDGDPLMVLSEGAAMLLPPAPDDPEQRPREVFAAWVTDEDIRLRRQFSAMDGLHHRARVRVLEPLPEITELADLAKGELTGVAVQSDENGDARLHLADPTPGDGFWVGCYVSPCYPVGELAVLNDLRVSASTRIPAGTSITREWRIRYRPEGAMSTAYTPWTDGTPDLPEDAVPVAVQARLYLVTNDPTVTPEVFALALDQVRFIHLTTGFWDTHRAKLQSGRKGAALSVGPTDTMATRNKQLAGGLQESYSHRQSGMAPASMQRLNYTLGERLTIHWYDKRYTLHRASAQYQLGRVSFRASPSLPFNAWEVRRVDLFRRRWAGGQRVGAHTQRHVGRQGPLIKLAGQFPVTGSTHPVGASPRFAGSILEHTSLFRPYQLGGEPFRALPTGVYSAAMKLADVKRFLGLRALVVKLDHHARHFVIAEHTMSLGEGHRFGANYGGSIHRQATGFIQARDGSLKPADPLRPATYHIPLNPAETLQGGGESSRRGILGFDTDNYAVAMATKVPGYEGLVAVAQQVTSGERDVHGKGDNTRGGETVYDALIAGDDGPAPYQIAQVVTSWRGRAPGRKAAANRYYARDVLAARDAASVWLSSKVSQRRTLEASDMSARGFQQLRGRLGEALRTRGASSTTAFKGESVRLRAVRRNDMGLDPMSAYPVQLYRAGKSPAVGYRAVVGLGKSVRSELVPMLGRYSQSLNIGESLSFLLAKGSRVHELRETIRFALDWIALRPAQDAVFTEFGDAAGRFSDAILLRRALPQRTGDRDAAAITGPLTTANGEAMPGDRDTQRSETGSAERRADRGQSASVGGDARYQYQGVTSPITEQVFRALSDWAGVSPTERTRFVRQLIAAEAAEDMGAIREKLHGAASELVTLAAQGRPVSTSGLIRFMTAAYLTGNLSDASAYTVTAGASIPGMVDLLYKTLESTSVSESFGFDRDRLNTAVRNVTMQLVAQAATADQDRLFQRLRGIGTTGTQRAAYRQYRWQNRIDSRVVAMPGYVGQTQVQIAATMLAKLARATSERHTTTLRLFEGLTLTRGQSIRFRPQKGATGAQARALRARHVGWSVTLPTSLKAVMSQVTRYQTGAGFSAFEQGIPQRVDVTLRLGAGTRVARQRVGMSLATSTRTEVRATRFAAAKGIIAPLASPVLAVLAEGTRLRARGQGWHLTRASSKRVTASLKAFQVGTVSRQLTHWEVAQAHRYGEQHIALARGAGSASREQGMQATHQQLAAAPSQAVGARRQQYRHTTQQVQLDKGFQEGVTGPAIPSVAQHVPYGEQDVSLTSAVNASTAVHGTSAAASSWQSRAQGLMVEWSLGRLKGLPQKVLLHHDAAGAVPSPVQDYRLVHTGITVGKLVDMLSSASLRSQYGAARFFLPRWSSPEAQVRFMRWSAAHVTQRVQLRRGGGSAVIGQRVHASAELGATNYWHAQMLGQASRDTRTSLMAVTATPVDATPAQLAKARYTRATFESALRAKVTATLWYQPVADEVQITLRQHTSQRVALTPTLDYHTFRGGRWEAALGGVRAKAPPTGLTKVHLRRMAGSTLRLGPRVWASVERAARREIEVGFSRQRTLNSAERMVLLTLALSTAVRQQWRAVVEGQHSTGTQQTLATVAQQARDALGDPLTYHITGNQRREMADVFTTAQGAMNAAAGNRVTILPHAGPTTALTAAEAAVLEWSHATWRAHGGTGNAHAMKTLDDAIDMLRQLPLGTKEVKTSTTVFGRELGLADIFMNVMQPLARLQTVFAKAMGRLSEKALVDIDWRVENSLRHLPVATAMRKHQALAMRRVGVDLSRAASLSLSLFKPEATDMSVMRGAVKVGVSGLPMKSSSLETVSIAVHVPGDGLLPIRARFHVRGSLNLPGGGQMPLQDTTVESTFRVWSQADSYQLQGVTVAFPKQNIGVTHIGTHVVKGRTAKLSELTRFHLETGRIAKLSDEAKYWLPKLRHVFPLWQANYLQDYGHVSPGLQSFPSHSKWLKHDPENKVGTYYGSDVPEVRASATAKPKGGFHLERRAMTTMTQHHDLWHSDHRASVSVHRVERWLRSIPRHHTTQYNGPVRDWQFTMQYRVASHRLEQRSSSSTRNYLMVRDQREARAATSQHIEYHFALRDDVPLGPIGRVHSTLSEHILATEVRTLYRQGGGMDVIEVRPFGEKDTGHAAIPVAINDWSRVRPESVTIVLHKVRQALLPVARSADQLGYHKLALPSAKALFRRYMGDLTGLAFRYWDYRQNRFTFGAKAHEDVIRIMQEHWFGEHWFEQNERNAPDFTRELFRLLNEAPREIDRAYRQNDRTEGSMMHALIQSNVTTPDAEMALRQAGLTTDQIEFVLRQTQRALADAYYRLRQFQNNSSSYARWNYNKGGVPSVHELDRMYRQRRDSETALYRALLQTGVSEWRASRIYEQVGGFGLNTPVVQSAYTSYQNMVNAVGAAYEQYLLSDPSALMHYRMHRPMDVIDNARYRNEPLPAMDVIEAYRQASSGVVDEMGAEYVVEMATVLDSIDYSLLKPLSFYDRVDVNLPLTFRSEDFRRYKAGIVAVDLMQWLRDLRTEYREELIAKIHAGAAKGTYSPRAAMIEAIRNNVIEPILYRDPDDGSWLYRQYSFSDTEYNYIIWGNI